MNKLSEANADFTLFPAIDLRDGRVVRLRQGDPGQMRVYGDDPIAVAKKWIGCGTDWLHVVNLDGAFDEKGTANWSALSGLVGQEAKIQFGGGLRALPDLERALSLGVSRVILGTIALDNQALLRQIVAKYGPDRIVAGIDARDGQVRTHGWVKETNVTAIDLGIQMKALGVCTAIYTDISRDGDLTGPNLAAAVRLARETGLEVIVAGGVTSLSDVIEARRLAAKGIVGLVIGRALYDGQVDLKEAILLLRDQARW